MCGITGKINLVTPGDSLGLANAILRIGNNSKLRVIYGTKAHDDVKMKYGIHLTVNKLEKVLRNLAE